MRLQDRLQDQHEEIAILCGQICCCGQEGYCLALSLVCKKLIKCLSSTGVTACCKFIGRRGEIEVGLC